MEGQNSLLARVVRFFLTRKLVAALMLAGLVVWGLAVAPFAWELAWLPRDPVPVDAIPDIGENQQIVFSEWPGRSPQDVEDQVTYPLTTALLGVPGVETIRSFSMFGFSNIYVIFAEGVDFYWSRSRILEKLNSLPTGLLPEGVQPALGPDATALGQVFWYTLEGRDEQGAPAGGWDLHELRRIQDWQVRYALLAAHGVSEVASVGGFVQEYQIDVNPDALRAYGVRLDEVFHAVRMSNRDVGARTVELNRVEYIIRGIGFVKGLADLENAVIKARDNVPIYVKNVAQVALGPAARRGALDKEGAEVVGGVVVARFGANPLAAIESVKAKIAEIAPSLPKKTLPDGRVSQVQVIPFYDRSGLIEETLGTLERALSEEVLVTVIVVLALVMNLRGAALVSGLLPLAVLACFAAMKVFGIDANIVALSGIAIAIGTMVDMGIVISENILKHLEDADAEDDRLEVIFCATREVGGAVLTAVLTTVVGFLPVFAMEGAEGKLFAPLAFTKTFALLAAGVAVADSLASLGTLYVCNATAATRPLGGLWPRSGPRFVVVDRPAADSHWDASPARRPRTGGGALVGGAGCGGRCSHRGRCRAGGTLVALRPGKGRMAQFSLRRWIDRRPVGAFSRLATCIPPRTRVVSGSQGLGSAFPLVADAGRRVRVAGFCPRLRLCAARPAQHRVLCRPRRGPARIGQGVYAASRRRFLPVDADDHAPCLHRRGARCPAETERGHFADTRSGVRSGEAGTGGDSAGPRADFHD